MSDRSWNWRIVEYTAADREWAERMFASSNPYVHYSAVCRKHGCGAKAECIVAYDYVTGACGRVSSAKKHYCRPHAQALLTRKSKVRAKSGDEAANVVTRPPTSPLPIPGESK